MDDPFVSNLRAAQQDVMPLGSFLSRLTDDELLAALSKPAAVVVLIRLLAACGAGVYAKDARVVSAVNALVAAKCLTAKRGTEILDTSSP